MFYHQVLCCTHLYYLAVDSSSSVAFSDISPFWAIGALFESKDGWLSSQPTLWDIEV